MENTIPQSMLEAKNFSGDGFMPLVDYETWRVAMLCYHENLLPQNIMNMQRHDLTDEIFVLLKGKCILFLGEGDQTIDKLHVIEMAPGTVYNVKRSTWHTHTLSTDAQVLIVENRNTAEDNSPFRSISSSVRAEMIDCVQKRLNLK
jgi:ureidoglycolate hydrolase